MVMATATYLPLCDPSPTSTALTLLIGSAIYFLLYITVISFVAHTESCLSLAYSWIKLVVYTSCDVSSCISAQPDYVAVVPRSSITDILKSAGEDDSVPLFQLTQ